MRNRKLLLLVSAMIWMISCSEAELPLAKTERPGEPTVYGLQAEDAEMNAAMARARWSIDKFRQRLTAPPPGQSYVSLKARFEAGDSVEHIWLDDISLAGDQFRGVIANEPLDVHSVKLGQIVTVPLDRVSDWMAVENDRLIGGYTLRVIRNRMSLSEREEFDASLGFQVE